MTYIKLEDVKKILKECPVTSLATYCKVESLPSISPTSLANENIRKLAIDVKNAMHASHIELSHNSYDSIHILLDAILNNIQTP